MFGEKKDLDAMTVQDVFDVSALNLSELLAVKANVEARLPPRKLSEINLEEELILQWNQAKELQNNAISDNSAPLNQQAQTVNACSSAIKALVDAQEKYYNQERFKKIEQILIDTLKEMPQAAVDEFFKQYEERLTKQD